MKRGLQFFTVLLFVAASMAPIQLLAQEARPSKTLFFRPSFGLANYLGDNNRSAFQVGVNAAGEIGYQFTPGLSFSALYSFGDYTDNLRPNINTGFPRVAANTRRQMVEGILRFKLAKATSRTTPYIQVGGGAIFGGDHPDDETGFGPLLGLGLDFGISSTASFFIEANANASFPDTANDGIDRDRFGSFDLFNRLNVGVQFNFKSPFVPVEIFSIDAPTQLEVGQTANFMARSNLDDATQPLTYRWDFGDGTDSPLMTASHSFSSPGTYTVTFSAENGRSTDLATHTVVVTQAAQPAQIVTINADPMSPDTRTPVSLSANVIGDAPVEYLWTFSDGGTATGMSPTYSFTEPGNYIITLRASNAIGSDEQTMRIVVSPFEAAFCTEVVELNSAFFDRNSSTLSPSAEATLQENVDILTQCANMNVRVDGYAVQGERNPFELSADRARAVEEFYVQSGIPRSRVLSQGQGLIDAGSLKEGLEGFRRSDTTVMN